MGGGLWTLGFFDLLSFELKKVLHLLKSSTGSQTDKRGKETITTCCSNTRWCSLLESSAEVAAAAKHVPAVAAIGTKGGLCMSGELLGGVLSLLPLGHLW